MASKASNDRTMRTVVYAEDMSDEMLDRVIETAKEAFQLNVQGGKINTVVANYIRARFDKEYGRGWNCVVGSSFGAFVTHEIKTYVYFSITHGISILLWRA